MGRGRASLLRLPAARCHLENGQARIVAILYLLAPLVGIDLSLANPAVEITLPIGPGIRFTGLYAGPAGRDSLLTLRVPRAKRVPILDVCGGDPSLVEFFQSFLGKRHGGLLIAGGVGCGKTTTLRTISECLIENYGVDEHVVVVEDNEELLLEGPQVTSLCSTRWYPYREVLRGALRQRPTRLIVGEVRGAEAFDAVKAGAAAGAGLYMTIHAPTAAAAVRTLLSRMREGSENGYVDPSIITDAIQYVLVMTRRRDKFSIRNFAHLERVDPTAHPSSQELSKNMWLKLRPYTVWAYYLVVLLITFTAQSHAASSCGSAGGGSDLSAMTGVFEYVAGIMSNQVAKTLALIAGGLLVGVAFFDGGQLPNLVRIGVGILGGFCFFLFALGWIAGSSTSIGCVS